MKILNTLIADIAYNNANTGLNAQTLQEAIDALYQLFTAEVIVPDVDIDGGTPQTLDIQFTSNVDGGSPSIEPTTNIDGGTPSLI